MNQILDSITEESENFKNIEDRINPLKNNSLKKTILAAKKVLIPQNYIEKILQFAKQGYSSIEFRTYDTDWDSEAYVTVSGQNSNNSIRVSNEFLSSVQKDGKWNLIRRTDGSIDKVLKSLVP